MRDLTAISHKIVQEAVRMRTPVVLLIFVIGMIPLMPFVLRDDGTLRGQLQLILNYSVILTVTLLSLQSIYLTIHSFTGEIKYKHFFLIDAKPVARWKFLVGKFLGLAWINLVSLTILGTVILVALYLGYSQGSASEKKQIRHELLTSYRGVKPYFDEERFQKLVEAEYKSMTEENRLAQDKTVLQIRGEIRLRTRQQMNMVPLSFQRRWLFQGIPTYLRKMESSYLKLRYKTYCSNMSYQFQCNEKWDIGSGGSVYSESNARTVNEFHEIIIPVSVIEDDGSVIVAFTNYDEAAGIVYFPVEDGMEVLYPQNNFLSNFLKAFFLLFLVLSFLVFLALFASTFLTFPIAILFVMYFLVLGMLADFLLEFAPLGAEILTKNKDTLWSIFYQKTLSVAFGVFPNFSEYVLTGHLSNGRLIEWSSIAKGTFILFLFKGGLLILFGCFIFNRREVGKPTL